MLKECKFCGQMVDVGDDEREGYYYCNCGGARAEIDVQEQIEEAGKNIEILFGEECIDFGFAPVKNVAVVETLKTLAALVARREIGSTTMVIPGSGVAIVKTGGKGEVKVTRRVTQANTLDAASVY